MAYSTSFPSTIDANYIPPAPPIPSRQSYPSRVGVGLIEKISIIAKSVFSFVFKIIFYVTNPNLFGIGFVVGIVWGDGVQVAIDKVTLVWKLKDWKRLLGLSIFAFSILPITIITCAFLSGANFGHKVYQYAASQNESSRETS